MYLPEDDWIEFRTNHPEAFAWLIKRSLVRELERLRSEVKSGRLQLNPSRKEWVESRLEELEYWEKTQ